ncbi:hypothetical protein BDA96_02G300000 [Sorghum bicolor]|uniref:Uncharacterized protein n=2 Tax=Sorghum bicolor TaxID=4558 RepID=A0A921RRK6_SORBI|nr:hypothetical protein BDA96_02G300000 [Sorghum bicolor]OQU89864.1 hypothetical protein SORBI_3002G285001 [Sorghum bicolor]
MAACRPPTSAPLGSGSALRCWFACQFVKVGRMEILSFRLSV